MRDLRHKIRFPPYRYRVRWTLCTGAACAVTSPCNFVTTDTGIARGSQISQLGPRRHSTVARPSQPKAARESLPSYHSSPRNRKVPAAAAPPTWANASSQVSPGSNPGAISGSTASSIHRPRSGEVSSCFPSDDSPKTERHRRALRRVPANHLPPKRFSAARHTRRRAHRESPFASPLRLVERHRGRIRWLNLVAVVVR